jgi:hypothetical protein
LLPVNLTLTDLIYDAAYQLINETRTGGPSLSWETFAASIWYMYSIAQWSVWNAGIQGNPGESRDSHG